MPFRSIAATPEELAVIIAAFEDAWTEIQTREAFDPLTAPGQRERLAYIIVELWSAGPMIDLARLAVQRFDETVVAVPLKVATPP